jgi:hypothetical protein
MSAPHGDVATTMAPLLDGAASRIDKMPMIAEIRD